MEKPINWKKNLFFIWLAEICSRAGFSMSLPFIAYYMRDRFGMGDEAVKTGMMWYSTSGSVALFLSFPLWGMVGDRMGRRPMLLRAMFCSGILYASFMFAPAVGILILLRFVTGFFSGTVSPAQALAVSTSPENKQGFALGVVSSAVWSGNVFGLLGGLVVKYCSYNAFWKRLFGFANFAPDGIIVRNWSYFVAFSLTMLLFLIGGFIVVFFVRENFVPPPPKPKTEDKKGTLIAFAGFGCAVYAILGMFLWMSFARRCDESYISLMVEVVSGLKGKEASHIMTMVAVPAALGSMLSATFIGFFSDRLTMRQLLFPITIIGTLMMLGQALSVTPGMLAAFRFMTFLVVGGLEPVVLGLLSRESPKEKKGTIFGYVASLRILGLMFGTWFGRGVMKLCDTCFSDGIRVFGMAIDSRGIGIRSVFMLGAAALLMMIPWIFFVERMVARRHRQLEQSGN
ncbi:MAG: MFS transporter [Lentisphaeria bacterium]|nr:MFS transporter [Lentisphaeria bacterium]